MGSVEDLLTTHPLQTPPSEGRDPATMMAPTGSSSSADNKGVSFLLSNHPTQESMEGSEVVNTAHKSKQIEEQQHAAAPTTSEKSSKKIMRSPS
eukprot:7560262-Ditylum_brightwellii.AAC.1